MQLLPQPQYGQGYRCGPGRRGQQHCRTQRQTPSIVARSETAGGQPTDDPISRRTELGIVFSQQQGDVEDKIKFPCAVPLLPFPVEEVLLPGSVKSLHLFEARYITLLDEVLNQPGSNKLFAHVVVEQQGDTFGDTAAAFPGAYQGDGYVFVMATLVRVVEVKKSFVGALVHIQAEARVEVQNLVQAWPYFEGLVVPLCDQPLQDVEQVQDQVQQLTQTVRDLQNLTQRFKSPQTACLQQAVYWAHRAVLIPAAAPSQIGLSSSTQQQQQSSSGGSSLSASSSRHLEAAIESPTSSVEGSSPSSSSQSCNSSPTGPFEQPAAAAGQVRDEEMVLPGEQGHSSQQELAEKAARLSFAALQGVPEESPKEQLKLLRCRVKAMKTRDTSHRLSIVQEHMTNTLNTLAAKCALKSLNLG